MNTSRKQYPGLVLCPIKNITYFGDFCENVVACSGPNERPALGVISVDKRSDLGDEIFRADERGATDLALGEECKPALDLIEP